MRLPYNPSFNDSKLFQPENAKPIQPTVIQSHSLLTAFIRRKANGSRPSRFDSSRFAISSPPKSGHLKYPEYYDPILTSSFAFPFRFVRTSRRGGTAPTRHSVGGGREKNRVPSGSQRSVVKQRGGLTDGEVGYLRPDKK